jgi:hypothetical protein
MLVYSWECTGSCSWDPPSGFASVLVYGDRTVVVTDVTTGGSEPRTVTLRAWRPSEGVLDELYVAVDRAGLLQGGRSEVGSELSCADCSRLVFTSRLGGRLTRVSAPCMCSWDDPEFSQQRAALRELADLLDSLREDAAAYREGERLEPSAYVLFVWGSADHPADLVARGVDLSQFVQLENGPLCGLVPAANPIGAAIVAFDPYFRLSVGFGDEVRIAQARPAYPHEHTCADIDY